MIYFCFVIYYKSKKILSVARESNTVKWGGGTLVKYTKRTIAENVVRLTNILLYEQQKIYHGPNVNAIKVVTHVERNRTSRTIYT